MGFFVGHLFPLKNLRHATGYLTPGVYYIQGLLHSRHVVLFNSAQLCTSSWKGSRIFLYLGCSRYNSASPFVLGLYRFSNVIHISIYYCTDQRQTPPGGGLIYLSLSLSLVHCRPPYNVSPIDFFFIFFIPGLFRIT